jgi:hypothetical protein
MAGSNSFVVKPSLPEPFPNVRDTWTCTKTGLIVPKHPIANLDYRQKLLVEAEKDDGMKADLMWACRESPLFYFNAFCWTYRQNEVLDDGREIVARIQHVPFITWEVQDRAITDICHAIDVGKDLGIDKSRDMGASWIVLTCFHHRWLFFEDQQLLLLSRTEDYVDKAGNHKALFWKLDYLNQNLPDWMRPPLVGSRQKHRTSMHMHNILTGSTIDGESTTKHAARGDRRAAILLDEFAAVENGEAMRSATSDVTPCRIVNSTPQAGTEYSKWMQSGQIEVFKLAWWEHPDKGRNRYYVQDDITKKWCIRSPWYDIEAKRRSPKELAAEVDMDHLGSGDLFFEPTILMQHKALFGKEALSAWDIDMNPDVPNTQIARLIRTNNQPCIVRRRKKQGHLKVWGALNKGRLDQTKSYVIGIDLSKGQAASNSVASVTCVETREKVAELAIATVPPYEFARMVVALALWVGGIGKNKLPFLIWEMNGPGWDFGRLMVKDFQYPCYYVDRTDGTVTERKSNKYGWHNSGGEKKEALLSMYRRNLAHGGFVNHCKLALDEAERYIYYTQASGKMAIGPAGLQQESENAKKTHGDRVIADALCLWVLDDGVNWKKETTLPEMPMKSAAYRRQQLLKRRRKEAKENRRRKKFNFSNEVQ